MTKTSKLTAITVVLLAGMLTACGQNQSSSPTGQLDLSGFYHQDVRWTPCPATASPPLDRLECGRISVPLDYQAPSGERIQLAVSRLPATDAARRIGSLIVNPGGPGGGMEQSIPSALAHRRPLERYDWVGYDPRGVGESAPVRCLAETETARLISDANPPRTARDWTVADTEARRFARACRARSGPLASMIGLANSARDLDVLRAVLHEDKLRLLATSYGGQIAATYAELFPDRVGRLVLNSPGNPTRTQRKVLLEQAAAFEDSLGRFADYCVAKQPCVLGTDRTTGVTTVDGLLRRLETNPLPTKENGRLTRAAAEIAMTSSIAEPTLWPALLDGITGAIAGNGGALLDQADLLLGRREDGTFSNFMAANTVINCLDSPDRYSLDDVKKLAEEFIRVAPRFGLRISTRLLECSDWAPGNGRIPINGAPGAAPILVLGNTADPEAPLPSVREVAGLLRSSVLVVNEADGHGSYGTGSTCVDVHADAYLLEGTVPAPESRCPN